MLLMPIREKNKILAQRTSTLTRKKLSWLLAIFSLPLFGVVTAFGIAPSTSFKSIQIEAVVRDLSIPDIRYNTHTNSTYWRQENIRRGDTISAILTRLDVKNQDKVAFLSAARESKAMRRLMPGKTIYAQTTADGELLMMRYFFGNEELFLMEKIDHIFQMSEQQVELGLFILC